MTIKTWDEAEAKFAAAWPTFQPRPQQRLMAQSVARCWSGNANHPRLLAQAGCGVGKSVGYLVPTIASGRRAVVAVSTKALQDQVYLKDLPMLKQVLFPDLTFAVLKGRSNYVCARACDKNSIPYQVQPGSNGERGDLVTPVTDDQWRSMSVDADGCIGRKQCPFADQCFSERAKRLAAEAQVVVVNTSLLTQHLKLALTTSGNASMLGDVQAVVVDEAHEMPDIVASGLSTRVTMHRLTDTLSRLAYHLTAKDVPVRVARATELAASFFNGAAAWFQAQDEDLRTADLADDDRKALGPLIDELAYLSAQSGKAMCSCEPVFDNDTGEERLLCEYARRTSSLLSDVADFADDTPGHSVVWMEYNGRQVALCAAPAEVGGFLDSALWNPDWQRQPTKAVLCSATLAVGGDASYLASRLGISGYDWEDVGTPFDYKTQARLYLAPASAPNPAKQYADWKRWAQDEMYGLIDAAGGGALLLFTSSAAMREAHQALAPRLRRRRLGAYLQGDGLDNRQLAARFAADTDGVLFATRSFMTGVDFAGSTCRLVVVDKMPFPVPTEPVFKARCEAADRRWGEKASFRKVSVPDMSMVLMQAAGRLIRTVEDRGVVAILDPRLRAGWALSIRRSLPPAPLVGAVDDVRDFFAALPAGVAA